MLAEQRTGPIVSSDGAVNPARGSRTGASIVADAHGRYQEGALRGNTFFLSASAAAPTAYVGAAGGTPLLALHNPAGSGKNLVILLASIVNAVAASAAGTVRFGVWVGPSVLPTGTFTTPTSILTLTGSGAVAKGVVNAAMTSSTALSFFGSLGAYYWATAAGAFLTPPLVSDLGGVIVVIPGNEIAIGASAALTTATWDATLVWEEVPV